jgi:hypothetical protein
MSHISLTHRATNQTQNTGHLATVPTGSLIGEALPGAPLPREQEHGVLAAAGWGDSNSTAPVSSVRGQGAIGLATWGFTEPPVTARARCCPRFAVRLRTQRGPREFRSRLVAAACGAPVLRDQISARPAGRPNKARQILALNGAGHELAAELEPYISTDGVRIWSLAQRCR